MFKKIVMFSVVFGLAFPCSAQQYLWPLKDYHLLSSAFGDYRDFHFHAGIDIRTGGKIGAPILAPSNGTVLRIRTSYWGYGKVLYFKADDGRVFVFAHMSDFAPKILRVVQNEQLVNRRYYVDILPEGIKVKKGELIGYSGESGIGGPHLHFEVRNSNNQAINPLICGFGVTDTISPVLKKVAFKAMNYISTVNGSNEWLILPLHYNSRDGIYTLKDTLTVDGKLGLALSVFDRMNKSGYGLGVHQIRLFLDGKLLFFSSYDSINLDETYKIDLERSSLSGKNRGGEFYKLFLERGNDLKLYIRSDGTVNTQADDSLGRKVHGRGYHQVEILVTDINGNEAKARFDLLFSRSPMLEKVTWRKDRDRAEIRVGGTNEYEASRVYAQLSEVNRIHWREKTSLKQDSQGVSYFSLPNSPAIVRITAQDEFGSKSESEYIAVNQNQMPDSAGSVTVLSVRLDYALNQDNFVFHLFFDKLIPKRPDVWLEAFGCNLSPIFSRRLDDTTFYVVIPFAEANEGMANLAVKGKDMFDKEFKFDFPIPVSVVTPLLGAEITSPDGIAKIQIDEDGVYENVNLIIQRKEDANRKLMEKTFYSVGMQDIPLKKGAKIWLKYPIDTQKLDKLAIYGCNRKGTWEFIGKEIDEVQRAIKAEMRYFSIYALGQDTMPPTVEVLRPKTNQIFKEKRPKFTIKVQDDLSGIGDDRDVKIYLDGEWLIPEYDIDSEILQAKPHFDVSYGRHSLTVEVRDRMGNKSSIERPFVVVKR